MKYERYENEPSSKTEVIGIVIACLVLAVALIGGQLL